MAKIDPAYLQTLQHDPNHSVAVIVKTLPPSKDHTNRAETLGLTVTHTFSLLPAFAATGPASAVMALISEPWVVSIEPDQPVYTTN